MNTLRNATRLHSGTELQLVQGDITEEKTEAIVNAANEYLRHGAGVAGAILARGGSVIQEESIAWVRDHGLVTSEDPAWTSAGNLLAKYVIHAVGPVWGDGDEDARLADALRGSLRTADSLGLCSIAIPAISTGSFGFPKERAAVITLQAIRDYFQDFPATSIRLVRLVLYDQATFNAFSGAWHDHFHTEPQG